MNGRYYVGEWLVEPEQSRVVRGSETAKLDPKAIQVLSFLAGHPNEVLTKEQIIGFVWDGAFVSDEVLTTAVWGLRKALGDDAKEPRYIQTIPRRGYRLIAPVEGASAEVARAWQPSPYPGLMAFSQRDARYFFGREEEIEGHWKKLHERNLLALIGPSGAGKSSLIRAGLIPAAPEGWGTVLYQPRKEAFEALSKGIDGWRNEYRETLWIVDQFEELFTLHDEGTQKDFAELLGWAAASGVHVLLSMRDDFLIRCHDHPALSPVFEKLTPLKAPEGAALRRTLTEPARAAGYRFEDEALVAEILTEVSRERGALPLLAFAASKLWEKRDRERRLLTREAYLAVGGVGGALAKHGEETLSSIGAEREPIVRDIFRNLTTASGMRVPMDREELLTVFPDREAAGGVLRELIDARLMTSAGSEVEVIHESLLSAWPRLVRWQAQDAEGAVLRDQLRQAARAWQERGRPDDLLWTGTSLLEFRAWRARYRGGLSTTEEAFAQASTRLAGQKQRRRRLALGATVAAAILFGLVTTWLWRRAEAQTLRAEASKLLALAELRLQEDPTEALAFATASLELADTEEARVFAMRALWEAPPAFELSANSQAMRMPAFSPDGSWLATAGHATDVLVWPEKGGRPIVLSGHEVSPRGPNWARWASNDLLVTLANVAESGVHLWSIPEGKRVRTIELGRPSFWQSGTGLLLTETMETASPENPGKGILRSWTLPDGEAVVLGRIDWTELGTTTTFFAPDGSSWFYAKERALYSRPLPIGSGPDRRFATLGASFQRFWSGADWLAIADKSGETRFWSYRSEEQGRERAIRRPETATGNVLPDPSGRWLSGVPGQDKELRLWDVTAWSAARPLTLRRRSSWYGAMSGFHPTGNWVVASTEGFTRLTFWPLARRYPVVVEGYSTLTRPLAFSPDGKWLATNWEDRWLRLWPLRADETAEIRSIEIPETPFRVRSLAFDPKGRYLFAVGARDQAWVVPLNGSPPWKLEQFSEDTQLNAAAVSPSGRFLATAFSYGQGDKTLRVLDLETRDLRRFDLPESPADIGGGATGYERGVASLGFADDSTLYGSGDRGLHRWRLDSGSHEVVAEATAGYATRGALRAEQGVGITAEWRVGQEWDDCPRALLHDLRSGTSREITSFGDCGDWSRFAIALDPSGTVAAIGYSDGTVRVGRLSEEEPHLLVGHKGAVDYVAISPDLRWVATTGEDDTLRLWPMPDLSKQSLHTLAHDELLSKLQSLTNLRVHRDPTSATAWKMEIGPFPGWKEIPTW